MQPLAKTGMSSEVHRLDHGKSEAPMGKASRHSPRSARRASTVPPSWPLGRAAALALVVGLGRKGPDQPHDRPPGDQIRPFFARWTLVRQRFLDDGAPWPSWSWLPPSMVMAQLGLAVKDLLLAGLTDEELGPYVKAMGRTGTPQRDPRRLQVLGPRRNLLSPFGRHPGRHP